MKVFAHRGWSAGVEENSIEAFKKSVVAGVDGIEFDVRLGVGGKTIVVTHNRVKDDSALTLDSALAFLQGTKFELLIEMKEYTDELYKDLIDLLNKYSLTSRTFLFAFPHIASKFPWNSSREASGIRLGIIAPLPQHIRIYAMRFSPDMILIGWGDKAGRTIFKSFWSMFPLRRIFERYPSIRFVIGVAYGKKDVLWLSKQTGLYGYTIDDPTCPRG